MKVLDSLSLKPKLALVPALCLALLVAVTALALTGFLRLSQTLGAIYDERLPSYTFAARLEADVRDMNGLINQSLAFEAVGFSAEQIQAVDTALTHLAGKVGKDLEKRQVLPMVETDRQAWKAIATSFAAYRKFLQDTLDLKSTGLATASTFVSSANKEYASLLKAITTVSTHELDRTGEDVASARARIDNDELMIGGSTVLALLLAVGLGWMITRAVVGRVALLSEGMSRLAEGDLSRPIVHQGDDELGRLMTDAETVRSRLAESMRSVHQATESVRVAAGEIAAGNADLGHRTEATSGALQQTSSSMSQLNVAVSENADAADRASAGASEAAESARTSGTMMSKVVTTMGEITTASQRIAEITGVIDGIAFQTNILALNAAVEAARAGEQGRGFAVVASEVRSLAQRSAAAAKEITTLIHSSAERVQAGSQLVERAGGSIDRLVHQVAGVAEMVSVIRSATVQQGGEIGQISASLTSLDQSTQQNAALVEQSTAASESLRQQADHLAGAMRRFRLD